MTLSGTTPTRQNYSFAGWATSENGVVSYSAGGTYTSNSAITLYAIWSGNPYTISLNNQSATSAGTTAIYGTYGTGIYLDSSKTNMMTTSANGITIPSKNNVVTYNYNGSGAANTSATATCGFGGYYTGTNGSGTQMIANTGKITNSLTNVAFSGNTTLYAKWTLGSVTLPNATRTNYIFNGWYTSASGGSKVGNAGASYTPPSSTTLYAQWLPNPQVSFSSSAKIVDGSDWKYIDSHIQWICKPKLEVFAVGNGSISYQWYKSINGGQFSPISGASSSVYEDSYYSGSFSSMSYYCVVTCVIDGARKTITSETLNARVLIKT